MPLSEQPLENSALSFFQKLFLAYVEQGKKKVEVNEMEIDRCSCTVKRWNGPARAIFLKAGESREKTEQKLKQVLLEPRALPTDVVVVGGNPSDGSILSFKRPIFTLRRLGLIHLGEIGKIEKNGPIFSHRAIRKLMKDRANIERKNSDDWKKLQDAWSKSLSTFSAEQFEMAAFFDQYKSKVPFATIAFIGWTFLVALSTGHPFDLPSYPVMGRLGALVPETAYSTEWYRLFSGYFAIGNLFIWALASLFLYFIWSRPLEKLVGTSRFIVLIVAGSLLMHLGDRLLFHVGLLSYPHVADYTNNMMAVSALYIVFKEPTLLPKRVLPYIHVWLYLFFTFYVVSAIDDLANMAAFILEMVLGYLIVSTGFFTRDLKHYGQPSVAADSASTLVLLKEAPMAAFLSILLIGSSLYAVVTEKPWLLYEEKPPLALIELPSISLRLQLPADLPVTTSTENGAVAAHVGAPHRNANYFEIRVLSKTDDTSMALDREREHLFQRMERYFNKEDLEALKFEEKTLGEKKMQIVKKKLFHMTATAATFTLGEKIYSLLSLCYPNLPSSHCENSAIEEMLSTAETL